MAFKDTDKILVNRDGVDYQAEVGPLMGGSVQWDDIEGKPCIPECGCVEIENWSVGPDFSSFNYDPMIVIHKDFFYGDVVPGLELTITRDDDSTFQDKVVTVKPPDGMDLYRVITEQRKEYKPIETDAPSDLDYTHGWTMQYGPECGSKETEVNDGVLTLKDEDGKTLGTFSANPVSYTHLTLPTIRLV